MADDGTNGDRADLDRSLFEAIVESTGDAIVSVDRDGRITSWNRAAEQLYRYQASDVAGKHIGMLFPQAGEIDALLARVFAGEQVAEEQAVRVRRDGTRVLVGETLSPVRARAGIAGAAVITRDIGERIEVERSLAATRRELEEKNRSLERSNTELEQFAYVASHDLSEPLRAVAGMVSLLARRYQGQLDADADEFISFAVEGCERMRAMIEDLLDFSRAGRMQLHPQSVDLAELASLTVDTLRNQVDQTQAQITIGHLPVVYADRAQIGRVLQNLITNGLKFHREDEVPRLTISANRLGAAWRVEVADNGIGIEPQYRPRIFGMFERLHTRDAYPGTGMGLAIAERIVDRHGGTIGADENPAGGAVFWFTLPDGPPEEHES